MKDDLRRYSGYGLLNLLLAHARLMIVAALGTAVLAVVLTVVLGREYTADSSFQPQAPESRAGQLAGLAAQFGISVNGLGEGESVDFYAMLLTSREVLEEVATSRYRFAAREAGADTLDGTLLELYHIQGGTRAQQLRAVVRRLRQSVGINLDRNANVVFVTTTAPWPGLAEQVNRRLLDMVNEFNLEKRQFRARAQRQFIEKRLAQAKSELATAQTSMRRFLEENVRWQNTPRLALEHERLSQEQTMKERVYQSLADSYEQARVDEVRNTPVVTILDAPEGSAHHRTSLASRAIVGFLLGAMAVILWIFLKEFAAHERRNSPEDYAEFRERRRLFLPWRRP